MTNTSWEPTYGFCAHNETDKVALAKTLEALRRQVCAYGGGDRCDCKYGLSVEDTLEHREFRAFMDNKVVGNSEQTGCPELREMIHRLLHRDVPLF